MATAPIQPQGPSLPSLSKPAPPAAGREAAPRPASMPGAKGPALSRASRPGDSLEIQLARIFARHAMQAQRPKAEEAPALSSRQTRGVNLDILA